MADVGKLRRMSHVQLQSLAKTLNIKANMKADKIRDAIMEKMAIVEPCEIQNDIDPHQSAQTSNTETVDGKYIAVIVEPDLVAAEGRKVEINDKSSGDDLTGDNDKYKTKLRRRTYDVITPISTPEQLAPTGFKVQAKSPDSVPAKNSNDIKCGSSTESIYYNAESPTREKTDIPSCVESTLYLSAKRTLAASPRVRTPRVTPKMVRIDRSVGQTPVKRVYNLRSAATNLGDQPSKSLIPRPVKGRKGKPIPKTPNFSKIHQQTFEKMISLHDHISKKDQLRENYKSFARKQGQKGRRDDARSKVQATRSPASVFQPTVFSTKRIDLNFAKMKPPKNSQASAKEAPVHSSVAVGAGSLPSTSAVAVAANTTIIPQSSKPRFDLQKSLARKLRYKPHTGPLKPLDDITFRLPLNNVKVSGHDSKTLQDKYKSENATFLKGVRRNRRLDLQLKMRGLVD